MSLLRALVLFGACLLSAFPAFASPSAAADGQFTLDKSVVVSGEPIWLTFRLVNHSTTAIRFYEALWRGPIPTQGYTFAACDSEGHTVRPPFSAVMSISGVVRDVAIAPGETYQRRLFLSDWFTLRRPGTYRLKCRRPLPIGALIESNLSLTVLPPDKKALGHIIQSLGKQTQSDDGTAREEAAISLAAISDPRVVAVLAAILERPDPPDQTADAEYNRTEDSKYEAISGLSHFPSDASARALLVAMNGNDDELRKAAGRVLQKMHYADRVLPTLRQEMHYPAAPLRVAAIRAVASLQDPRGFGPLVNALHDPTPSVRVAAAKGLGTLRDRRAVPILRSRFHDPDLTLRLACIESLVPLRYPALAQWLTPIVRSYAVPGHESPSLEAMLALRRDCGDWAALMGCLSFDDPRPSRAYNFLLIAQMDACHNGSEYARHWIRGGDTPEAIENNRKILAAIKRGLLAR